MQYFAVILLGIATNLDNLCVSVAFSARGEPIRAPENLILSLISGLFALFAAQLAGHLSAPLLRAGVVAGGMILIGFGLWPLLQSFFTKPSKQDENSECHPPVSPSPGRPALAKTLLLGGALGLNCLPTAFGAGAMGLTPVSVALSVAVFSGVFVALGKRLGSFLSAPSQKRALDALAGLLLIVIGMIEICT